MKKILPSVLLGLLLAVGASAHVTVKPNSVGLAARQVFTISVPNEKDIPTTGLRLVLPDGIGGVTPTVKPGWKIEVKRTPTGNKITDPEDGDVTDEMKATEIIWSQGSIPAGQRDEFTFSTQAPSAAATLAWKAYQTYSDGSVVSWDQAPGKDAKTPYSTTAVVDDLAAQSDTTAGKDQNDTKENGALALSIAALALSVFTITRKRQ